MSLSVGDTVPKSCFIYNPTTLKVSLRAIWEMTEASGNRASAISGSALAQTGTVGTGTISGGNAAGSYSSSNYLSLTDEAPVSFNDSFTIALWMKANSVASYPFLIAKGNYTPSSDIEYQVGLEVGVLKFTVGDGNVGGQESVSWGSSLTTATEYHIIAWFDNPNNTLGITVNNGTPVTNATLGSSWTVQDGGSPLMIGILEDLNNPFNGYIRQLALWNKVLSSTERTVLYNGGTVLPYTSW